MRLSAAVSLALSLAFCAVHPAQAQTTGASTPATTTFWGDTGLWFVPSPEVLPHGRWSLSGYRANFDREQGFTDLTHIAVTFGVGVGDRMELFGSWRVDTRIDRDVRPLFNPAEPAVGGQLNEYPLVREGWTGDTRGDALLGVKLNLKSSTRSDPFGLAIRGVVKLPTGAEAHGATTDAPDLFLDAVGSAAGRFAELSVFGGLAVRGDPDEVDLSSGVRWGIGVAVPPHRRFRLFTELHGEAWLDGEVASRRPFAAVDGSAAPALSPQRSPVDATVGLTWQHAAGSFVGVGLNWSARHRDRSVLGPAFEGPSGDRFGVQVRLGFHPGIGPRATPPSAPASPPPPPPSNRPPTVEARCEPCTVHTGQTASLTAEAQDPDGDLLTYAWRASSGTVASAASAATQWTAGDQPGRVPVTISVSDGRGGNATDTVTMTVTAAARLEVLFEDVHFDFDRYSLRPAALRILDEVATAMQAEPAMQLEIEGHTCNIGTAEYNLALGDRRATAVRVYLAQLGIASDRLQTVSFGEERPKHDNSREETRRLNRRAALVVRAR